MSGSERSESTLKINIRPAFYAILTSLLIMLGAKSASFADSLHYKNMIVGDRPASMGGAYTAVSDTPEGTFYNPAGLAYTVGRNLSVSVNAYHSTWTNYKNVIGSGDWERKSSSVVPNFFGVVQPLGIGKVAISYAVPDIIEEDQNQMFTNAGTADKFIINLGNRRKTYKIGPSYAVRLSETVAAGATLYFHYREEKLNLNQYFLFSDNTHEWQNVISRKTEYGIDPRLGIMWTPLDKVSLGLTVSKINVYRSNLRLQQIQITDSAPPFTQAVNLSDPSITYFSNKRKSPLKVSAGAAFFPSEALLFACDIDYFEAVPSENKRSVVNFSLGTEYYLSERYALRGGLFSDIANSPMVKSGLANQDDHVDMYGFTGGLTRFTRTSSMTLGISYAFGEGDAQPVGGVTNIYEAETRALTLFFSGSYSY